jgi:hypothetical protein
MKVLTVRNKRKVIDGDSDDESDLSNNKTNHKRNRKSNTTETGSILTKYLMNQPEHEFKEVLENVILELDMCTIDQQSKLIGPILKLELPLERRINEPGMKLECLYNRYPIHSSHTKFVNKLEVISSSKQILV